MNLTKFKAYLKHKLRYFEISDLIPLTGVFLIAVVLLFLVVVLITGISHEIDMSKNAEKIPIQAEVMDKRFYTTVSTTTDSNKNVQVHTQFHYEVVLKYKDVVSQINSQSFYNRTEVGNKVDCTLRILEKGDKVFKDIVLTKYKEAK